MNAPSTRVDHANEKIDGSMDTDLRSHISINASAKVTSSVTASELEVASALTRLISSSPELPMQSEQPKAPTSLVVPEKFTRSGRRKATPFPLKLMKILSTKEYEDIVSWLPDGCSFAVLRPVEFIGIVLPEHFKEAKYASFTRKLHRWGFQRRGDKEGSFFHPQFRRDRLDLAETMTCGKHEESTEAAAPSSKPRRAKKTKKTANKNPKKPQEKKQKPESKPVESTSSKDMLSEDAMDIALELEITRRLRERVTAAQRSRQALAEMEQKKILANALERQLRSSILDSMTMRSNPPRLTSGLTTMDFLRRGLRDNYVPSSLNSMYRPPTLASSLQSNSMLLREDEVLRRAIEVLDPRRDSL